MTKRFRKLAQRFLVRRYGMSVDWNCTYREIAQATGLPEYTVTKICREAGYPVVGDDKRRDHLRPMCVDVYFSLRSRRFTNHC